MREKRGNLPLEVVVLHIWFSEPVLCGTTIIIIYFIPNALYICGPAADSSISGYTYSTCTKLDFLSLVCSGISAGVCFGVLYLFIQYCVLC